MHLKVIKFLESGKVKLLLMALMFPMKYLPFNAFRKVLRTLEYATCKVFVRLEAGLSDNHLQMCVK